MLRTERLVEVGSALEDGLRKVPVRFFHSQVAAIHQSRNSEEFLPQPIYFDLAPQVHLLEVNSHTTLVQDGSPGRWRNVQGMIPSTGRC